MGFIVNLPHKRFCKIPTWLVCKCKYCKAGVSQKELIEIEKRQVIIPDPVMKVWLKGSWEYNAQMKGFG